VAWQIAGAGSELGAGTGATLTAWLLRVLDGLSPGTRRALVVSVALLAVGAAIVALTVTSSSVGGGRARKAPSRPPAKGESAGPPVRRLAPPVSATGLRGARRVAERFLSSYLLFAYGRARAVRLVTSPLRRQLTRKRARVTPVERRRHPRVVSLRLLGTTPGFVVATAIVSNGRVAAYQLRFTLQESAGRWVVGGVQEG
jgi:hypothetical protein